MTTLAFVLQTHADRQNYSFSSHFATTPMPSADELTQHTVGDRDTTPRITKWRTNIRIYSLCTRWCSFDTKICVICHFNGDSENGKIIIENSQSTRTDS